MRSFFTKFSRTKISEGILVSSHDGYSIRFVTGIKPTQDDINPESALSQIESSVSKAVSRVRFDDVDSLRFENTRNQLRCIVFLNNSRTDLANLLSMLRQVESKEQVVEGAEVGFGLRLLLWMAGRSIVFAREFSTIRRSIKPIKLGSFQPEVVESLHFVFAQLRGWFRPGAVILALRTVKPAKGSSRNNEFSSYKWRLSFKDCSILADGLEKLLSSFIEGDGFKSGVQRSAKK